jgi:hypothetical protein
VTRERSNIDSLSDLTDWCSPFAAG